MAERTAQHQQTRSEVLRLEAEAKTLRAEAGAARERAQAAEAEAFQLRKYRETHGDPEVLVTALKAMREKNVGIEKALSAETKLKMDLFSAFGDARRELEMKQGEHFPSLEPQKWFSMCYRGNPLYNSSSYFCSHPGQEGEGDRGAQDEDR